MKLNSMSALVLLSTTAASPVLAQEDNGQIFFRFNLPAQIYLSEDDASEGHSRYIDINADPGNWRENETIHFPITTSPSNATLSAQNLPGGLAYNPDLRAIVGNTAAGAAPYKHTFRLNAASGIVSDYEDFDLVVYPQLQASYPTSFTGTAGESFDVLPTVSGVVETAHWAPTDGESLPPGIALDESTGALAGTYMRPGVFSGITIRLQDSADGKSVEAAPIRFEITAPDILIVAADAEQRANILVNIPVSIAGGFEDPEVTVTGLPAGVTFNSAAGAISGTAAAGTYPIKIAVGNTWNTSERDITLKINPALTATLQAPTITLDHGDPASKTVATTNALGTTTWTIASGSLPAGLSLNNSGEIVGTPNTLGSTTATLQVTDAYDGVRATTSQLAINVATQTVTAQIPAGANRIISSYFNPADWANPLKIKRAIVNGVIGSTSTTTPALRTGTAFAGNLIVEVPAGAEIQGAGGAANRGGGGTAFLADSQGVQLINNGAIRAGGGGGGNGGNGGLGGGGSSVVSWTREPSSGQQYLWQRGYGWMYGFILTPSGSTMEIYWAGQYYGTNEYADGWYYRRGSYVKNGAAWAEYGIYRERPNYSATNGGAGGSGGLGGRGQGYDGALAAGSSGNGGAAGGAGAGYGGAGGNGGRGGGWGENGASGANGAYGAAGNNGSGQSGTPGITGGTGGWAIQNAGNVSYSGTGVRQGSF